jgi:enoyl-CoA hydratase/carnithine racemase
MNYAFIYGPRRPKMAGLEIREIIITRDLALDDGLELESDFWSNLTATEDMKEGAQAFIEKRKPNYQCR